MEGDEGEWHVSIRCSLQCIGEVRRGQTSRASQSRSGERGKRKHLNKIDEGKAIDTCYLPAREKSAWSLRAGSPPRAVHIMFRSSISQLLQINCKRV